VSPDLSPAYQLFGEPVTVAGQPVRAIVDLATQLVLGDAIAQAPVLRVMASVAATEGAACTVRGLAYVVRQVLDLPPDAAERQLVLSRVMA
jgi:hypothetical protein